MHGVIISPPVVCELEILKFKFHNCLKFSRSKTENQNRLLSNTCHIRGKKLRDTKIFNSEFHFLDNESQA